MTKTSQLSLAACFGQGEAVESLYPGVEDSFVSGEGSSRPFKVSYRAIDAHVPLPLKGDEFQPPPPVEGTKWLLAEVVFTRLCHGPPGKAHGGSSAAALDEFMGGVAWMNGRSVLARSIQIDFRQPVALEVKHYGLSLMGGEEGQKVSTSGWIADASGEVLVHSTGLFLNLGADKLRSLVGLEQPG